MATPVPYSPTPMSKNFAFQSDDAIKEKIRSAIDIVELVSQYVDLRRSGRHYVGHCPWHDDSKPSLQVNHARQSYKCWVCDIGGDVFSFVMKAENVGFREALEILADKAGITLPQRNKPVFFTPTQKSKGKSQNQSQGELAEDEAETSEQTAEPREITRQTLFSAADWLAKQYHEAFFNLPEAEVARRYVEKRKINEVHVKTFEIGYAPLETGWLLRKIKGDPFRCRVLEIVGNLVKNERENVIEGNEYYDRFRGRLIFPIRDTQDRVVAFGGRVIPESGYVSQAKYVNSPETPLFSKHKMLYGFGLARQKMRESKRVLITEGYTDCIIAHQFGFNDAVAVLGTALGPEDVKMLQRGYAEKMYLILDGDEAGVKRAAQVLEFFVALGVDMSVLTLPEDLDPCEFLEKHGAEAFQMLIENDAVPALDHAFKIFTRGIDLDHDILGSSQAIDKILGIVAQAPAKYGSTNTESIARLDRTLQKLAGRFRMSEEQLRRMVRTKQRAATDKLHVHTDIVTETAISKTEEEDADEEKSEVERWFDQPELMPDGLEREMLELWLLDPTAFYEFWETVSVERCRSPITRLIYKKCDDLIKRDKLVTFDHLIVAFNDLRLKSYLVDLDESAHRKILAQIAPESLATETPGETTFHDELSDVQESLRNKTAEEVRLPMEIRKQLVQQILTGFERRDRRRQEIADLSDLRRDDLSDEEKSQKLLDLFERKRKEVKKDDR